MAMAFVRIFAFRADGLTGGMKPHNLNSLSVVSRRWRNFLHTFVEQFTSLNTHFSLNLNLFLFVALA